MIIPISIFWLKSCWKSVTLFTEKQSNMYIYTGYIHSEHYVHTHKYIHSCMHIHIHTWKHTFQKKYALYARNLLNCCNNVLLMLGWNFTFLVKWFKLRMAHDVMEFVPYLQVFLIGASSNLSWLYILRPLVLQLC